MTESPPYITAIPNKLCMGDNNVTVRFGLQTNDSVDCEFQKESNTTTNGGRFYVPTNIILASQQQQPWDVRNHSCVCLYCAKELFHT